MRVPCIMRWPGRIPAGQTCYELCTTMDLLPTFCALSGAALPGRKIDGKDIGPLLRDEPDAKSPHDRFYCYYGGVDKIAHERGFGPYYDAELRYADALVADVLAALPSGTALLVTADHGQVDVGERVVHPSEDLLADVTLQSGEGRFRWLHTDEANEPSAGVPAKLGYHRERVDTRDPLAPGESGRLVIWTVTRDAWQRRATSNADVSSSASSARER